MGTMVPDELRRELRHRYSSVRVAELKSGGDFPFLSQPEEVALFVEVHMRGIGVFANGTGSSSAGYASAPSVERSLPAERPGAGASSAPAAAPAAAAPTPSRPSRPKWINPFDEPPVKPRAWNNSEDPLL